MRLKQFTTIFLLAILLIKVGGQDSLCIGFSIGDFHVERWQKDKEYFVNSANALGAKVYCEYAYGDEIKQAEQIDKLIDLDLQVILIIPTDASALKEVINKGKKKGIIFISYDRLIMDSNIDYYISFNNQKVGELQAGFAISQKSKGNYILLAGPKKDNNAIHFLKGQKNILQPYIDKGDIKILHEKHLSEWSSMDAFLELQNFFESNNEHIDAVVASNDLIASGVLMAYDMLKDGENVVLTGQDANIEAIKNINSGRQSMTVYKPILKLAKAAAKLSIDILKKEKIKTTEFINNNFKDVPSILLESTVVTKENIEATVIADGYYTESEVFDSK